MTRRLDQRVALVTGGSSGIGRSTALAFAREGSSVVVSAHRNVVGGEATVAEIRANGGRAIFIQADVSKTDEVQALVGRAVREYGSLDIGFNNAGIQGPTAVRTADYSEEDWDRVLDVNLTGAFLCMKYELAQMLEQEAGTIVNTSSISGSCGTRDCAGYVASMHALIGLTRAAALDHANSGIRINAICPGFARTSSLDGSIDLEANAADGSMVDRIPVGRIASPDEVAEVVVWLCSDAASYVTAHALTIDGGLSAQL